MRKIAIIILALIPLCPIAQIKFDLKGKVIKSISAVHSTIDAGTQVKLIEIKTKHFDGYRVDILYKEQHELVLMKHLSRISFMPSNIKEFWQVQAIEHGVYDNIISKGWQYKLRKETEDDVIEYLELIEKNNLIFNDSYLESYLYSLICKIYPIRLDDGRPGILNVKLLKDFNPNAFIFPNGTMFITTGLLSTINSEDELIGVLAHEISHFVLDHSIININKAIKREKRAIFWTALATGIAATAEIYVASKNENYMLGGVTASTAMLAYSIALEINKRMGINYSQEQEMEADRCAVKLMQYIEIKPEALSSALSKIKNYCVLTGNHLALTGEGSHPALNVRISAIGNPSSFYDPNYDKKISFINSYNAIIEFQNKHLTSCKNLVTRNINAGVATEIDYKLLAMCNIRMYDNEEKNKEALELINKAKSLNVSPQLNSLKQEAIILIRLKRLDEAKNSLKKYREILINEISKLDKINNETEWSSMNRYLKKEYEWTAKMIYKVDKL